jgi:diguanylate cyclase (GGDEF)-like protein
VTSARHSRVPNPLSRLSAAAETAGGLGVCGSLRPRARPESRCRALQREAVCIATGRQVSPRSSPEVGRLNDASQHSPTAIGPISLSRDADADARDRAADERDRTADERDEIADCRDQVAVRFEALIQVSMPVGAVWSASARRDARSDRRRALARRQLRAIDRRQAERDRAAAYDARTAAGPQTSAVDDLTGLYLRNQGFAELHREIARSRRESHPLVVAFVDVDGLKAINDTHGHAAGDATLIGVARALQRELRAYDVIFRYGGDEFVCALPGVSMEEAHERFAIVRTALKAGAEHGSVSVGMATLRHGDSAPSLVARADDALYIQRGQQKRALPTSAGNGQPRDTATTIKESTTTSTTRTSVP